MESYGSAWEYLKSPAIAEAIVDVVVCAVPIWLAVMIGLMIGWSWRPRWTGLLYLGLRSKIRFAWTIPAGRFWLAFTAFVSALSILRGLWRTFRKLEKKSTPPSPLASDSESDSEVAVEMSCGGVGDITPIIGSSSGEFEGVVEKDLEHLLHLLDGKDGEMAWQGMMERSTSNMTYQAWRHEPEIGPMILRSRTIFEDATPELVRDFFWDDEFRTKWDAMLTHVKILEEDTDTGMMIMHWIKKFPFFCSDREYIIGRRIWEGDSTYYCVTKGGTHPNLPRRDKPRRVDLYSSSWVIKPAPSRKGDGSACEVTLIHYEDMGIPKDVARLGVRHGMWGTVKKLHAGFRAYQNARKSDPNPSRCALMAKITAKIPNYEQLRETLEQRSCEEEEEEEKERSVFAVVNEQGRDVKKGGGIDWRLVAIGGAVAVVCGLRMGLVGKAVMIGVGRRIAQRRGNP